MGGHDLELEKARLLSLALNLGFDEESANDCLDRLVDLYGEDGQDFITVELWKDIRQQMRGSEENPAVAGDANRRFQQIQEAYSVLSDQGKRSMYDAGIYDPLEEEDEEFGAFMQEMISMMNNTKGECDSFEDLQTMFEGMVANDRNHGKGFNIGGMDPTANKKPHVGPSRNTSSSSSAQHGGC